MLWFCKKLYRKNRYNSIGRHFLCGDVRMNIFFSVSNNFCFKICYRCARCRNKIIYGVAFKNYRLNFLCYHVHNFIFFMFTWENYLAIIIRMSDKTCVCGIYPLLRESCNWCLSSVRFIMPGFASLA